VENIPGHHDHRSDDRDQLIGIIPERVIGIIPESVIGMPRNTDRHRPESPNPTTDFFTQESFYTFVGVTGMTFGLASGFQKAFDKNPKWVALLIAVGLCLFGTHLRGDEVTVGDYVLGIFNGFLVFCTVAGSTAAANKLAGGSGAQMTLDRGETGRSWLTPWF
jgi:hypothetical protein